MRLFHWFKGRQDSGYSKLPLWLGPLFDCYILHYPTGSEILPHVDPVAEGRKHYRLNIVLWHSGKGGEFVCNHCILALPRIRLFRPDQQLHSVTKLDSGQRYVLSIGWLI